MRQRLTGRASGPSLLPSFVPADFPAAVLALLVALSVSLSVSLLLAMLSGCSGRGVHESGVAQPSRGAGSASGAGSGSSGSGTSGEGSSASGSSGEGSQPPHQAAGCPGEFNLPRSVRKFACDGVWVRPRPAALVPQGLALGPNGTAYLSGYLGGPPGQRPCQVLRVDRDTGKTLNLLSRIEGEVPGRGVLYCHHGGGIGLNDEGLWVAETFRLWLLDPDALEGDALEGDADPVRRVWRIERPVRGSAMTITDDRIGLAGFTTTRPGKLRWYDVSQVMADGVVALGARPGDGIAGPSAKQRTPSLIQGLTLGPGGVWFSRSQTRCGILSGPKGDREFLPGAEGIAFSDPHHVWVVSESGARRFQRMGDRPVIPTLTRIDIRRLGESPGC